VGSTPGTKERLQGRLRDEEFFSAGCVIVTLCSMQGVSPASLLKSCDQQGFAGGSSSAFLWHSALRVVSFVFLGCDERIYHYAMLSVL
jgi:hypothetical protein